MENSTLLSTHQNSTSELLGAEDYNLHKIAQWLDTYSTYILSSMSVVLNSAAFFTICSMKPVTSTSIYIATLAVVDTLCLVIKLLTTQLVRFPNIPEVFACGVLLALFFFVQLFSSFLIVVISVERVVAVWFPFKVSRVFTRKAALFSLLGLSVLICPLTAWAIWFYERYNHKDWGIICVTKVEYVPLMRVFRKIHPLIYIVIPFMVVLILNIVIIVGLRRSFNGTTASGHVTSSRSRISRRLSIMLVVTSFAFLVLELPMVCLGLFKYFVTKTTFDFVKDFFIVEVVQTLEDLNHAVNFIFYFISGKKFRECFWSMLTQCVCRKASLRHKMACSLQMSDRATHRTDSNSTVSYALVPPKQNHNCSRNKRSWITCNSNSPPKDSLRLDESLDL